MIKQLRLLFECVNENQVRISSLSVALRRLRFKQCRWYFPVCFGGYAL